MTGWREFSSFSNLGSGDRFPAFREMIGEPQCFESRPIVQPIRN